MNLNKSHREEIVAAVMRDTPRRHKLGIGERLQMIIDKDIVESAPKPIGPLWKDGELGRFLNRSSKHPFYIATAVANWTMGGEFPNVSYLVGYELTEEAVRLIGIEIKGYIEELAARRHAQTALSSALAGIRTRKQFIEQFPELEKYAPEDVTLDRSVPAITNVMASLSKLGFPASAAVVPA